MDSRKEKGNFLESDLYFLYFKRLTVPWLIVLVFGNKFYTSFSYFCDWNTESLHSGFAPASWQARPKYNQLQSLQQI